MRHVIPHTNWTTWLADALENAIDGDTIVCHSENMKWLAERAHARMCPDKTILFEVPKEPNP